MTTCGTTTSKIGIDSSAALGMTTLLSLADYIRDFHKSSGVVALGFGELVVNEPDGLVQFRNNNVLEDINPPAGHLKLGSEQPGLLFLLSQLN